MKPTPMRAVVVKWMDTTSVLGWMSFDKAAELWPAEVVSIGFLMSNDRKVLRLGQCLAADGEVTNVQIIPQKWVRSVKTLGFATKTTQDLMKLDFTSLGGKIRQFQKR